MKYKLIFLSIGFLFCSLQDVYSQSKRKKKLANKDTSSWRYEVQCEGEGVQNTYVLKVWSYSKSPVVAAEQSKKNAIHAVIFQGISGTKCISKPPLFNLSTPNSDQEKFFNDLFTDGGDYMKFIVNSSDSSFGQGDVLKLSKREFKVGVTLSVNYSLLRKHLENSGIIKSLGGRF